MLLQDKFIKRKKFKRSGVLKTFCLPEDSVKVLKDKKYNVKIDAKTKTLKSSAGKYAYIVADTIGVCEKSTFSLFFVEDAMVVNLKKGYLYLQQEDGSVYILDAKNKVVSYTGDLAEISWRPMKDMMTICNNLVKNKFNLDSAIEIDEYRSNLLFEMTCYFNHNNGNLFSLKFGELDYTLGADKFNFTVKDKKEVVFCAAMPKFEVETKQKAMTSNFDFNDEDEAELEEIDCMLYDAEDESLDDIEELPSYMHEVDIFAEYSDEDM